MADRGCMSEVIRDILAVRTRNRINNKRGAYRHAGVLVPLLNEGEDCKVLFTERTHKVEHHKGQISFPGGGVDDRDPSIEATAIREAQEEIRVPPKMWKYWADSTIH
ncbi:MAG: NUDIX domain-containing protein [Deltaproteobacteria bacterium]|nr:NUDIX domain-containing protein [Deltaproteobacteria bacterium]